MTLPCGKIPRPTCTWKCLLVLLSLWWIKGPCIIWSQVCPLSTGSRSLACPPKALLCSGSCLLVKVQHSLALQHFPSVSLFPLAGLPPRLLSVSAPCNSTHTCCFSLQKLSASEHSAFAVLLPQPLFSLRLLPVSTLALIFPKQWSFLTQHIWSQQHLIILSFCPPWKTFFLGFYSTLSWSSFHVTGG